MPIAQFVIFFAWLATIAGFVMFMVGWMVPRFGFDAHCARCEYNVSRRPRGGDTCPECGADLKPKRAIVLGRRRIHKGFFKYGLLLFILGSPIAVTAAGLSIANVSIERVKPVWVLMSEAECGDVSVESTALVELKRRMTAKKLTNAQMVQLAVRSMSYGSSRPARIRAMWQGLYVGASSTGAIQKEILEQYVSEVIRPRITFRPTIRQGDPIPFKLTYSVESFVNDAIAISEVELRLNHNNATYTCPLETDVNGAHLAAAMPTLPVSAQKSPVRLFCMDDPALSAQLQPGPTQLKGELIIKVAFPGGGIAESKLGVAGDTSILESMMPGIAVLKSDYVFPPGREEAFLSLDGEVVIALPRIAAEGVMPVMAELVSDAGIAPIGRFELVGGEPSPLQRLTVPSISMQCGTVLLGQHLRIKLTPTTEGMVRTIDAVTTFETPQTFSILLNDDKREQLRYAMRFPNSKGIIIIRGQGQITTDNDGVSSTAPARE